MSPPRCDDRKNPSATFFSFEQDFWSEENLAIIPFTGISFIRRGLGWSAGTLFAKCRRADQYRLQQANASEQGRFERIHVDRLNTLRRPSVAKRLCLGRGWAWQTRPQGASRNPFQIWLPALVLDRARQGLSKPMTRTHPSPDHVKNQRSQAGAWAFADRRCRELFWTSALEKLDGVLPPTAFSFPITQQGWPIGVSLPCHADKAGGPHDIFANSYGAAILHHRSTRPRAPLD